MHGRLYVLVDSGAKRVAPVSRGLLGMRPVSVSRAELRRIGLRTGYRAVRQHPGSGPVLLLLPFDDVDDLGAVRRPLPLSGQRNGSLDASVRHMRRAVPVCASTVRRDGGLRDGRNSLCWQHDDVQHDNHGRTHVQHDNHGRTHVQHDNHGRTNQFDDYDTGTDRRLLLLV